MRNLKTFLGLALTPWLWMLMILPLLALNSPTLVMAQETSQPTAPVVFETNTVQTEATLSPTQEVTPIPLPDDEQLGAWGSFIIDVVKSAYARAGETNDTTRLAIGGLTIVGVFALALVYRSVPISALRQLKATGLTALGEVEAQLKVDAERAALTADMTDDLKAQFFLWLAQRGEDAVNAIPDAERSTPEAQQI